MLLLQSFLVWAPVLFPWGEVLGRHINSFAGSYIGVLHRFESCPSDGTAVVYLRNSRFNPSKPFQKQYVWGNGTSKRQFDDTLMVRSKMAVRSGNEWKENAFIYNHPGGGCSTLREQTPSIFGILAKLAPNLRDEKAPCVFPPGHYVIENQTVNLEFPKFKVMPYGRYRATVMIMDKRSVKFCFSVDCEVIPRP